VLNFIHLSNTVHRPDVLELFGS